MKLKPVALLAGWLVVGSGFYLPLRRSVRLPRKRKSRRNRLRF